ncbi:MAG TPA: cytochrome c biogenesis protein DipZ [Alphaproteobacteria bacterium]|nr:cytochrome c biogenesis protein DipZ [Alphaproteobacteria bacterium]
MLLFILAYFGGILTILSPCILPVLPFVFARSDQPFLKSGLPMLAGMALTFAGVATLAALGGGWAVQANQAGRIAALALLAFFGITLLFPSLAEHVTRPLVGLGDRLSNRAQTGSSDGSRVASSFLLGIGTGLLWAPCAGPILGLVLTGAALEGATAKTSLLLLAYGLGAATSLAAALLIGGRLFKAMKRSLGAGEWIRRGLGVAVLAGVAAIAMGADTGLLTRVSLASTAKLEQSLTDRLMPEAPKTTASNGELGNEGTMPPLTGATLWLNSPPLTPEALKGKVVLVDFWTYSCINCLRALPYVKAWSEKYKDKGLVVIGVHAPEFAFEKDPANVRKAVADMHIDYPVALDNDFTIWRAFNNQYWPAHYFIDANGVIRHHHFGEGEYAESEKVIQELLAEAGHKDVGGGFVDAKAGGIEMAADKGDDMTPETYVNYSRGERFASPEEAHDAPTQFTVPATLDAHHWGLTGNWTIGEEHSTLNAPGGKIVYRFHARDLHLVLGPGLDGKPVRFKVTIDGKAPGADHGVDTDADGNGTVTGQRLYQLIRQNGTVQDRTFAIEFLDPGVQAFAFTFG